MLNNETFKYDFSTNLSQTETRPCPSKSPALPIENLCLNEKSNINISEQGVSHNRTLSPFYNPLLQLSESSNPTILNFVEHERCSTTDNAKVLYEEILNNKIIMLLPPGWAVHKLEGHIIYSKLKNTFGCPQVERSITLNATLNTFIYINGIKITFPRYKIIQSPESLQELITKIDKTKYKTPNIKFNYKSKFFYINKKKLRLENIISNLRKQKINRTKLSEFTEKLPDAQKELVATCIKSSERHKNGVRYTLNWVYSCILMRIKSPKLYEHMRREKIMPLPCHASLLRYITKIDGNFGFKKELFEVIRQKTKLMEIWERHGTLLLDECKITPSKHFNKNTMQLFGFVDLGDYTPKKDENKLGDHVLIFMYQPFAGKGIQALACFLTKGNVTGTVQAKLLLECIFLCENSGLHIDAVTSDGATWNRSMWREFNVTNPLQPWCMHPADESRLLRFTSDWPHLIKCLRNLLIAKKKFITPDGVVKHQHFNKLLTHEAGNEFKIAYKLTYKHIWPRDFEKMSAKLAFQLFGNSVALALRTYKYEVPELNDCEPTIQFCERLNNIIDIMNSSSPLKALRYDSDDYKELENFLIYLDLWEQCSPQEYFLSKSTFEGLRATISSTLNLVKYLTEDIGFKYLMTARLNQDSLEHFFGMMRAAGGCNSHPESLQIGQIFRLMSIYSLVKPPRGSNVSGGEMLQTLLNVENIHQKSANEKFQLTFNIVVDNETNLHCEKFHDNKEAFAYLCGYLAKKYKNIGCLECKSSLIGEGTENFNRIITEKSRGFLTYPSERLYNFLVDTEMVVTQIFKNELRKNALTEISTALNNHKFKYLLGCSAHAEQLTQEILQNFIVLRLTLTCQKESKIRGCESKSKKHAKLAKLVN